MKGFPTLSIITWAPFVGAVLIMFLARHRPRLVRWIALVSTAISLVLSIWIYASYEREAAGFQFYEEMPLVPPLGITYQLGVDGVSLLLVLLTSIIIFAGVFASWTVKERGQEFYALLLLLVTGVYGVFVSLDLFVLFLFYEIAVLPMYLLIGIWGSSGEIRPQGIFGWAFRRTGVGRHLGAVGHAPHFVGPAQQLAQGRPLGGLHRARRSRRREGRNTGGGFRSRSDARAQGGEPARARVRSVSGPRILAPPRRRSGSGPP